MVQINIRTRNNYKAAPRLRAAMELGRLEDCPHRPRNSCSRASGTGNGLGLQRVDARVRIQDGQRIF